MDDRQFVLDIWKREQRKDLLMSIVMSQASYSHGGQLYHWTMESGKTSIKAQLTWQLWDYGSTDRLSAAGTSVIQEHERILTANTLLAVARFRESVLDSTLGIASLFQHKTYAGNVLGSCPAWSPETAHSDPASIEKAINSSGHARYGRYHAWPDVLLLGPSVYDTFARTHDAQDEKAFVYRGIDVLMEPGIPGTSGYMFLRDALRARFMTSGPVDLEGDNVEIYFVLQFTQPRAFTKFKGLTT